MNGYGILSDVVSVYIMTIQVFLLSVNMVDCVLNFWILNQTCTPRTNLSCDILSFYVLLDSIC